MLWSGRAPSSAFGTFSPVSRGRRAFEILRPACGEVPKADEGPGLDNSSGRAYCASELVQQKASTMSHLFRLDPSSGVPFYRQIIDQVLLAVADGRLKPGAQLPTVRQLAVDLSVNLNTVAKAYREMEIRGIVETQQGTGTFIAARVSDSKSREKKKA